MESREEATRGTHAGMIMCKHVTKLSFFFFFFFPLSSLCNEWRNDHVTGLLYINIYIN